MSLKINRLWFNLRRYDQTAWMSHDKKSWIYPVNHSHWLPITHQINTLGIVLFHRKNIMSQDASSILTAHRPAKDIHWEMRYYLRRNGKYLKILCAAQMQTAFASSRWGSANLLTQIWKTVFFFQEQMFKPIIDLLPWLTINKRIDWAGFSNAIFAMRGI